MAVQVQTVTVHSCASVRYGQIYTLQSHTFLPPVHNEHGSIVHYCTGPPLCPGQPGNCPQYCDTHTYFR